MNNTTLYQVERFERGFALTRDNLLSLRVTLLGNTLNVVLDGQISSSFAINEIEKLVLWVATNVYSKWLALDGRPVRHTKLTQWITTKIKMGLNGPIYKEVLNLHQYLNPTFVQILKKFQSNFGPMKPLPSILRNPNIYKDAYFISDLLKYNSIYHTLAEAYWALDCQEVRFYPFSSVKNWRLIFTKDQQICKALNKTLDNFPRGVPTRYAMALAHIKLQESIYDKVKLIAITGMSSWEARHKDCVIRSTSEEIRRAFKLYQKQLKRQGRKVRLNKSVDINEFIQYCRDFEGEHNGNIVGLYHKSVEWHGRQVYNQLQRADAQTKTATPKVALPPLDNVQFLSTVGEVVAEGHKMGHCIASYANYAVQGTCYLFHVEYKGHTASTMVAPTGEVVQSYGPRNSKNLASEYGKKVLGKWGRGFASLEKVTNGTLGIPNEVF